MLLRDTLFTICKIGKEGFSMRQKSIIIENDNRVKTVKCERFLTSGR